MSPAQHGEQAAADLLSSLTAGVEMYLAALPTDPDQIADLFAELNISGIPTSPCSCPVANYLGGELGEPALQLNVTRVDAEVSHDRTTDWAYVEMPAHVGEFIRRYDRGSHYEQLHNTRSYSGTRRERPDRTPKEVAA